jgi:tRNA 2-thiocytidine biosynthesis protein TtcA
VIRPLAYCAEKDIARYARAMEFPIIPCNLCGSQQNLQRQAIKSMLHEWERQYPGRTEIIFQSLQNVTPSHLLDGDLFDFKNLSQELQAAEGDIVFDQPDFDQQDFDQRDAEEQVSDDPDLDKTVMELKRMKS